MKRVNLIPMAGLGQRFTDAGYKVPKPLIDIGGRFMIDRAASSLPPAEYWVFICRKEHEDRAAISSKLKKQYPAAEVLILDHFTQGQASTCMLAEPFLDEDDCVSIGACDNAMIYQDESWERQISDTDILVWTFRNNPAVLQKPQMYSWAAQSEEFISRIAVKQPLSNNPMRDHALIGAFTFKKAGDFLRCGRKMHRENRKVNGEYYIDELVNVGIEIGLRAKVFEVDYYIGWGTPQDLETYYYWENSLKHFLGKGE
ncbi:hypothetical protein N9M41_06800 [Rhodopirellula sp.]|nr:hypothetical protein [Rhodopirellula sp.]